MRELTMEAINAQLKDFKAWVARGRDEYTGGPKYFQHMNHVREAAYPWIADIEMAGAVRMLMRDDLHHEAIVCAARDRILHLSEENARLRAALEFIRDAPYSSVNDSESLRFSCQQTCKSASDALKPQPKPELKT